MKWFRAGIYYLTVMGVFHFIGHIIIFHSSFLLYEPVPQALIVGDITIIDVDVLEGLSLWYSLFFLWLSAVTTVLYLQRQIMPAQLFRSVSLIHAVLLAVGTVISAYYFFWFPTLSAAVGTIIFCCSSITIRR